jgi:hypothetical protein
VPLQKPACEPLPTRYAVSLREGKVYINEVEVMGKHASTRFYIFMILLDQYWLDFREGKPEDQHTFLSLSQIAEKLEEHLGPIEDLEQQVRRPLNRIQQDMEEILARKLGLFVKKDDIIQTLGWAGFKKQAYGYRLNPSTLLFKK